MCLTLNTHLQSLHLLFEVTKLVHVFCHTSGLVMSKNSFDITLCHFLHDCLFGLYRSSSNIICSSLSVKFSFAITAMVASSITYHFFALSLLNMSILIMWSLHFSIARTTFGFKVVLGELPCLFNCLPPKVLFILLITVRVIIYNIKVIGYPVIFQNGLAILVIHPLIINWNKSWFSNFVTLTTWHLKESNIMCYPAFSFFGFNTLKVLTKCPCANPTPFPHMHPLENFALCLIPFWVIYSFAIFPTQKLLKWAWTSACCGQII